MCQELTAYCASLRGLVNRFDLTNVPFYVQQRGLMFQLQGDMLYDIDCIVVYPLNTAAIIAQNCDLHTKLLRQDYFYLVMRTLFMIYNNHGNSEPSGEHFHKIQVHRYTHSSIDHWNYYQTSKGHMTWIIQKVNRIPMHFGMSYEYPHFWQRSCDSSVWGAGLNSFVHIVHKVSPSPASI